MEGAGTGVKTVSLGADSFKALLWGGGRGGCLDGESAPRKGITWLL